jgi:glycogen(starch) synthase
MPNVVLESMAAGCPVIVSDVEGSRDLIEPGRTGWLFARDSIAELQHRLREALDDPHLGRSLANAAQLVVSQRFTWESVTRFYAALYCQLADQDRGC